MIPPPNLRPMKDFNPAELAILHDVVKAGLRYHRVDTDHAI
jgi:hypothetical protein